MTKTIHHSKNLNLTGKGYIREAVRAVIFHDSKILMIHSSLSGDYKFPGGGIEAEETHNQALIREISEECGLEITDVLTLLGSITEYYEPKGQELDFFQMNSHYYRCSISSPIFQELNLDVYERELGFRPQWINIEDAIKQNNSLLNSKKIVPRWTLRDTLFLEELIQDI